MKAPMTRATALEDGTAMFWAAFTLLALVAVLPFWIGEYMPLVDLPQHAAQLAVGEHWNDASLRYHDYYRINPYTNQRLGYLITHGFARFFPLVPALKCLLSLSVWGLAAAVYWLVRTVKGDPWWSLLAFPAAYSFSMYWGLLNYLVALPLGICLVVASTRFALAPSRGRALLVLIVANGLFLAHALILAYAGLVSAMVVLIRAPRLRDKLLGCAALASILPTVAWWWRAIRTHEPSTAATSVESGFGWHRLPQLFSYQISSAENSFPQAIAGAVLCLLPFLLGARLTRERWRLLPLVVTLLLFFTVPAAALDIDLLYGRVAAFALPALLFALDGRMSQRWQRGVLASLVGAKLLLVVAQFRAFDTEAQPLNRVLAAAQPGKRLLYLPTDSKSAFVPHEAYSHFGCFYQVKVGGVADYSFAELFPTWYRYRANVEPRLPKEFDSNTQHFRFDLHDGKRFDYLLVRGPVLDAWFAGSQTIPAVVAHAAEWTLLQVPRATPVEAQARITP